MKTFRKTENDELDYDIDMADWLDGDDSIENVELDAPDGIEVTGTDIKGDRVKIWLSGGEAGNTYRLSPVIETYESRFKQVDFMVVVTRT